MPPPEDYQHTDENPVTAYKVYPGRNDLYFWLYAEITRRDGSKSLEIMLPRTPIEKLSSAQHAKYQQAVAATTVESPSEPPQLSRPQETGSRRPALASL
jgi:hypothetical protein